MSDPAFKLKKDLSAYSDSARILKIEGVEYALTPLRIGDIADAQTKIRDERFASVMSRLRHTPLNDSLVAEALARVETEIVDMTAVFDDQQCRIAMVRKSLERGGSDAKVDDMSPGVFVQLWSALLYLSGIGGADDPFVDTIDSESKSND